MKELVAGAAEAQGKQHEVLALQREIEAIDQRIKNLTLNAARLEDLKKDHLIAEAVFSSALARVDTNKADIFASYPIVQTLAPPDLPSRPSQPRVLYAILGGVVTQGRIAASRDDRWGRHYLRNRVGGDG